MKLLELFSGSQSVGKVAEELGYEVVSLDIIDYNKTHKPTHLVNIMDFDYRQYKPEEFDIVWASPPCTYYSQLQKTWYGKMKKDGLFTREIHEQQMNQSDILMYKTLEIIGYFNPRLWFIENPWSGQLKHRKMMEDLPYYDVCYCKYSDWAYKKATRIWTNKKGFNPLWCRNDCGFIVNKKHIAEVSRTVHTALERGRIPKNLIVSLFS